MQNIENYKKKIVSLHLMDAMPIRTTIRRGKKNAKTLKAFLSQ